MWKVGPGGKLLFVVMGVAILAFTADRYLLGGRLRGAAVKALPGARSSSPVELTPLDFPTGAAAPVGDLVSIPRRPMRVAVHPRGSSAALLLASGGPGFHKDSPASRAFGVDVELTLLQDERTLVDALLRGGEKDGADAIALSVDRLVQLGPKLNQVRPKAILLLSESRGYEVLAASAEIDSVQALKGRKIAVPTPGPAWYFLAWRLAQDQVAPSCVEIVPAASAAEAARFFEESRVDAAVGAAPELDGAVRKRAGKLIASTSDAPHLVAHVLVVRGDFLVRYPDASRRLARAVLEQAELLRVDPLEGARLLNKHAPLVGDPLEALRLDPPSSFAENLAFFELKGDMPVRFAELHQSALAVWRKLGLPLDAATATADSRVDLEPLRTALANPPNIPVKPPPAKPVAADQAKAAEASETTTGAADAGEAPEATPATGQQP